MTGRVVSAWLGFQIVSLASRQLPSPQVRAPPGPQPWAAGGGVRAAVQGGQEALAIVPRGVVFSDMTPS